MRLLLCLAITITISAYEVQQMDMPLYGENYTAAMVHVTALKIDPKHEKVHFSLATGTEEFGGMHYDQINIYRVFNNGKKTYATLDPNTMRDDLLTLDEHIETFSSDRIFAASGYGNLIMDGYLAGFSNGRIIKRFDEPKGRTYFSLISDKSGLYFQDICYESATLPYSAQAISGQAVVKDSKPVKASAIYDQFDNIKHLLHLPFLQIKERTAHFAVDQLIKNKATLAKAAKGEAVTLELMAHQCINGCFQYLPLEKTMLQSGLIEKGYQEVFSRESVKEPGTYCLNEDEITIAFLPAINAHHFIAMDHEGFLLDIIVQGKSNRLGISLEEAGSWLIKHFDIADAIVIDNGADPMLKVEEKLLIPSFNGRTKIASALIYFE